MSTQIPVRRPSRIARPANDENAPSRLGVISRMSKPAVLGDKATTKPVVKETAPLKPTVASVRPRAALSTQQQENTNVAGKRKRDALGDATNGKVKVDASSKPSIAVAPVARPASSLQRASSTSSKPAAASTTAAAARVRAPLGVKSKNINPTTSINDKGKQSDTESTVSSAANARIIRRPGSVKRTLPSTTTAAAAAAKTSVTVSRKVTQTVREETKTQVVDGHKARVERIRATTKVQKVAVREDVDEDELRSHKRPRLSSEDREVPEAKELTKVTVEKVKEVLTQVTRKAEDETPDDLDKEDSEDPLMVAEYVVEIFEYLRALEKTTMPNPRYMEFQKALKPHMRGILGDWIIGIHRSLRMVPETLFIAMNLVDRFLSVRAISIEKVQLVGVVCLLIASKYEEICAPTISMMLRFSAKGSGVDEIKEAEKYVLKSLKYNLSYSSPITFLRRISKADGFDAESRTLAKYLVEIYCVDYELVQFPPSCIAAAAMWLARLALDRGEWTANLAHYAGYKEAEILPCVNVMLNYILKDPQHSAIFEKYASRKFNKASVYMRSWALARWDQGSEVDLPECLEALMEDSRLRVLAGRGGVVELIEGPNFGDEAR